jgi:hypothetical protein
MQDTGGTYGVALNEKHLEELVFAHAPPPPSLATDTSSYMVRSRFQNRQFQISQCVQPGSMLAGCGHYRDV